MARTLATASATLIAVSNQNIGRPLPVAASNAPPSTGATIDRS